MMTVGAALRQAAAALEAAGVREPRREADELYAALVQGATSAAWAERERPLSGEALAFLAQAVARRAAGEPQAYATGWANFRGHWLRVDERVLIPRPETEGLVEVVLAWARTTSGAPNDGAPKDGARSGGSAGLVGVDVGTGSGAVAVALALEGPFGRVVALDRSAAALDVARGNVDALGLAPRVHCLRGDLLEPLASGVVDVVASNPPYIATLELVDLERSVRDFEPLVALDGGPDGLTPTRRLAAAARGVLAPGGLLALEVDSRRARETASLVRDAGFVDVVVRNDLFERPRYVTALQTGE
jgi:release factor glutamine methyltransferase